jgi:hypothetical protein
MRKVWVGGGGMVFGCHVSTVEVLRWRHGGVNMQFCAEWGGSRWSSILLHRLVIFWRYCNVACRPSTRSHLAIHRLCDCPPTCRFVAKLTNTSSICLMRAQQGGILLCCTDFYSGTRIGSKAAPEPSRSAKMVIGRSLVCGS